MDDAKLIEQVRLYEELYNMADKNYNNYVHKEKIWFKIGKAMGMPSKFSLYQYHKYYIIFITIKNNRFVWFFP